MRVRNTVVFHLAIIGIIKRLTHEKGEGIELGEGGWWGLGELLRVVTGTLDSLSRQTVLPHKGIKTFSFSIK